MYGLLLPVQEQQGLGRCVPCLAATALSLHSGANAIDLSVLFWWQRHWPLFAFSGANAIALSVHFGAHACVASTSSYVEPYQGVAKPVGHLPLPVGRLGAHLCGTNQGFLSPTEERQRVLLPLPLASVKFVRAPRQAVRHRTDVD